MQMTLTGASLSFRMGGETVTISADKGGQFEFMHPEGRCTVEGKADGYKIIDSSIVPKITGAPYVDISKAHEELPEFDKDEKLLLVCDKGKRSYMLQQRLKDFGYTNTLVLEAGTMFNELK